MSKNIETKKPRSEAQKEASRCNGAKSRGPKTEAGKAISSQNARTHGLSAYHIIIDGESEEAWNALEAEYFDEWQPVGPTERDLVTQLAFAAFRLRRLMVMEPARINYEQAKVKANFAEKVPGWDRPLQQSLAYEQSMKQIDCLGRHESRLKRQIKDTIVLLQQLQDRRKGEARKIEEQKKQKEPRQMPKFVSINDMINAGLVEGLGPRDTWTRKLTKYYGVQPPENPNHLDSPSEPEPPQPSRDGKERIPDAA